jgi:hypothetical protein
VFKGIQAVRIDFFFILKVANILCFILIAVEIFPIIGKMFFFSKKKYNQETSSFVNNMQYNLFTIFPFIGPLCRAWVCFY